MIEDFEKHAATRALKKQLEEARKIHSLEALCDHIGRKQAIFLSTQIAPTLGDLEAKHVADLSFIPSFGRKTLIAISKVLTNHGLKPLDCLKVDLSAEFTELLEETFSPEEAARVFDIIINTDRDSEPGTEPP